jgi:adenosylcobinamide-GDP ribazoletransferase
MRQILIAFSFLTTLPIRLKEAPSAEELGKAAGWFPLVGALMGLVSAGVCWGLRQVVSPLLAAMLATAVWILLSGGLHLDGVADSFDGMLNASSPERRLEIMKDPNVGTFGALGLIMTVLLKVAFLNEIQIEMLFLALPLAAAGARWMLLLAAGQPSARPGGLGDLFAKHMPGWSWIPAGVVLVVLVLLAGWQGAAAILAAHVVVWLIFRMAKNRLSGLTGDVFGLTVEVSELVILLAFCFPVG